MGLPLLTLVTRPVFQSLASREPKWIKPEGAGQQAIGGALGVDQGSPVGGPAAALGRPLVRGSWTNTKGDSIDSSKATFFRRRNRVARDRRRRPAARSSVELKCGNPHGYWCFEHPDWPPLAVSTNRPTIEGSNLGYRRTGMVPSRLRSSHDLGTITQGSLI
jgi:hypothetical protein